MIDQYKQILFYHYILGEYSVCSVITPEFFDSRLIQECYILAKDYVVKYHESPSYDQMRELVAASGKDAVIPQDSLQAMYAQKGALAQYTDKWLYDTVTSYAIWKNYVLSLRNAVAYTKLKEAEISPENVREVCEQAKGMFNSQCMLDFGDGGDIDGHSFWDAGTHKQVKMKRKPTGYQFIDTCLDGGYWEGGLIVFAGEPKIGKSTWLCNLCAKAVESGLNCAYISLEMGYELVAQRLGSPMLNISSGEYRNTSDDEEFMRARLAEKRRKSLITPGELIIKTYATSSLSTVDLEAYLLKEELRMSTPDKPFKFDVIYIDYINIMRNFRNPNSENTYMKIKTLAEDTKAIGINHGWCMVTATQLSKTAFGAGDILNSQVAESSGLNATVDAMFGVICTPEMKISGIYHLKCMLDRVARMEYMAKKFDLSIPYQRITEDAASPVFDMSETVKTAPTTLFGQKKEGYQKKQDPPRRDPFKREPDAPKGPIEMQGGGGENRRQVMAMPVFVDMNDMFKNVNT